MYAPDRAALATSIGFVTIEGDAERITSIRIGGSAVPQGATAKAVIEALAQLEAYFAGRLATFDLPLAPAKTARGAVLRKAIVGIAHGQTASYGDLARTIGSSARAVGQACARNPFPLVVPCHRVLQAGGKLGPYSAGDGPATKRWLLALEAREFELLGG